MHVRLRCWMLPVRCAQGYYYFIFGFAFLVGLLTMVITIEVSIVCTYVQLCAEDYLWWYASPSLLSHRVHQPMIAWPSHQTAPTSKATRP